MNEGETAIKSLKECFDLHGTDKFSIHMYDKIYEENFREIRHERLKVLEIGVLNGKSLAAWLEYFPNSTIYGVDTFERIRPEAIPILRNERVVWAEADSTKGVPPEWSGVDFDIVIDDGRHTPEANEKTFLNFFPLCRGSYFIEDVWPIDLMSEIELQHPWVKGNPEYEVDKHSKMIKTLKRFGSLTCYDLRELSNREDSFVIRIQRSNSAVATTSNDGAKP